VPSPPLCDELKVDVAVVGAGINGLSSAWHLKRDDPSVTVALLEQGTVGDGASGRNNGILTAHLGLTAGPVKAIFGLQRLRELIEYASEALAYSRTIIREQQFECDHEARVRGLTIATAEAFVRPLEKEYRFQQACGFGDDIGWVSRSELAALFEGPLLAGEGAIVDGNSDVVNPVKLVREFKQLAVGAGVAVFERSPVIDIRRCGAGYRASTPGGAVLAEKLVLTTNAYSHALPGGVIDPADQWPIYAHQIATEPLSDAAWAEVGWSPDYHRVGDTLMPWHWARRTPDGRVTFGGARLPVARASADREYDQSAFARLTRHLRAFFPTLADARVTHRWGGLLSTTFDLLPHIGFIDADRRAVRVTGCWGHGMALGHLNGDVVSRLVREEGGGPAEAWFVRRTPRKWPAAPFRFAGMVGVNGGLRATGTLALRQAMRTTGSESRRRALAQLLT